MGSALATYDERSPHSSPDISVQKLVTDYFLIHPHGGYPVVRNDRLEGVVTMSSVRSISSRKNGEMETVAQAMFHTRE